MTLVSLICHVFNIWAISIKLKISTTKNTLQQSFNIRNKVKMWNVKMWLVCCACACRSFARSDSPMNSLKGFFVFVLFSFHSILNCLTFRFSFQKIIIAIIDTLNNARERKCHNNVTTKLYYSKFKSKKKLFFSRLFCENSKCAPLHTRTSTPNANIIFYAWHFNIRTDNVQNRR